MSFGEKTQAKAKRDVIALALRTSTGNGDIPAGEPYFVGVDWKSGDLISVRHVQDEQGSRVEVTPRSRFGGAPRHAPMVLLQGGGTVGFGASVESGNVWSGHGWQFTAEGAVGELRKIPEGTL